MLRRTYLAGRLLAVGASRPGAMLYVPASEQDGWNDHRSRDMTSLLGVCVLGFFLGMRHATDPDHVVAVTTIVSRYRSPASAAVIGALWGVGHTLTILVVGAGIILLGWVIPPRVGLSFELSVGLMLIVLGLMNLTGVLQRITENRMPAAGAPGSVHSHPHAHGDYVHSHVHGHDPEAHPHQPDQTSLARLDRRLGGLGLYQMARPLIVGVVHGLAGSAAVALLVMATIGNTTWSILYLLLFGVGTIAGMMLVTAGIAWPVAYAGARFPRLPHRLRVTSSILSLLFGAGAGVPGRGSRRAIRRPFDVDTSLGPNPASIPAPK